MRVPQPFSSHLCAGCFTYTIASTYSSASIFGYLFNLPFGRWLRVSSCGCRSPSRRTYALAGLLIGAGLYIAALPFLGTSLTSPSAGGCAFLPADEAFLVQPLLWRV